VYDFSTNGGVDRLAYGISIPKNPIPPAVNDIPAVEFSAADYTAIGMSDDARHTTGNVSGQIRAAVRFAFTIAEQPADVVQLGVLWEGGGSVDTSNVVEVWLWNAVTSEYEPVGSTNLAAPPDVVVTGAFSGNPADYLGPANDLTVLVTKR
jgi:hypothetical protein